MSGAGEKEGNTLPYHIIIEHVVNPVKETVKSGTLSEQTFREIIHTMETVLQLFTSVDALSTDTTQQDGIQVVSLGVVKDVCFPSLQYLTLLPDQSKVKSERRQATATITQLVLACVKHFNKEDLTIALTQMLIPLASHFPDNQMNALLLPLNKSPFTIPAVLEPLSLSLCLDLLNSLFNNAELFEIYLSSINNNIHNLKKETLLSSLFETLLSASKEEGSFLKAYSILSKLLQFMQKESQDAYIDRLWKLHTKIGERWERIDDEPLANSLSVFYCLRDFFFPLAKEESLVLASRMSNDFWRIVQAGLVSVEPAQRKLAMYLFKRLVDTCSKMACQVNIAAEQAPIFWWSPKSAKKLDVVWEDFTLLIETLEEKQVHVVKPLLPRMQKLISASSTQSQDGPRYFHASWLITIVSRCFQHDSHYMSRWGAYVLLTLNFETVPLIENGQLWFLSHQLPEYLQETKLYSRYEGTELGKSSPVGEALKSFFPNLFATLTKAQKVEYLQNILQIVCDNKWGSIPLVFLFQGLSHIKPDPILNLEHLKLIRHILHACLSTLEVMTRGAIQGFICQTLTKLMDLDSVSVWDFFETLAFLWREESLRRGSNLWKSVIHWLSLESVKSRWSSDEVTTKALEFIKGSKQEEDSSTIFEGYEVISIARMLALVADTDNLNSSLEAKELQVSNEASSLGQVLQKVSETLSNLRNRPYINTGLVDRSLALVFSLCKEFGDGGYSDADKLLTKHLNVFFPSAIYYIQNRLITDLNKASDLDDIKSYSDVLLAFGRPANQIQAHLKDLITFCNKCLTADNTQQNSDENPTSGDVLTMASMRILAIIFKILASNQTIAEEARKAEYAKVAAQLSIDVMNVPFPFSRKTASMASTSKAQVGRVISRFISSRWQCMTYLLQAEAGPAGLSTQRSEKLKEIFDAAMEDMSVGSGSSDIAIYQALVVVVEELLKVVPGRQVAQLLDMAWNKVMEEKKNILFWKKLEALIPLAVHKSLVEQDEDSDIGVALKEFLDRLCTLGSDKTGITYILYNHLCSKVLSQDPERAIATRLTTLLMEGCYFGTVHKKGERLWLDVCAYIESLGDSCAINQITSSISKNDLFARIVILNWLSTLSPDKPADRRFVSAFMKSLKATYVQLAGQTTYKQFANSLSHRQKHRMVVTMLMLDDFVDEAESAEYVSFLWHALEVECHPSVRQSLEWLVLRLLHRFPNQVESLWKVFQMYNTKRSVCLCSVFLIMSHVGKLLSGPQQLAYYPRALTAVLPWTMAHHYNTRIFAQTTMVCLWEQCKALALSSVLDGYCIVQAAIDFLFTNSNSSETVLKLKANYMYTGFDPVRDYSMETILHTLPRLACIADDEWILPRQLVQWDQSWESNGSHHLALRNSSETLAQCKEGPWRMKAHVENDDSISESADGDVQKKIMPWRQMTPDQETEAELASQRQKKAEGGLILVTSLIDKLPNLGGLCRTSEIFGVSEFVIGNLTHLEDRMFQSLSVSAQKWINITEVLRFYLARYLEEKRLQGYTLVGVEQTANSVSLEEYKFPKKTLLLLGNEKEGIPVDLLQMLDVAVEIPQLGVIRSLNVHVCGALIVWEYTRQQMKVTGQDAAISDSAPS